jgi:methionine-rich copper-binding protein CopC
MTKHIHLLPAPKVHTEHFPQYHRLFSAKLLKRLFAVTQKTVVWTLLTILILANILLTQPGVRAHVILVEHAIVKNIQQISLIRRPESVSLNTTTQPHTSVLGAEIENDSLKRRYDAIAKEYAYWQSVVSLHPDYRDGYYSLALDAYELGKLPEARAYLTTVRSMDPNYPGIDKLQLLLTKN